MKFLIDTNILIPLEPTKLQDLHREDPDAIELARRIQDAGHIIYVHPAIRHDIDRDGDTERRSLRARLVRKYPTLTSPPHVTSDLQSQIGDAEKDSNDWVDNQLIAALAANAVDYFVSNDSGIRRKAVRAGLEDRVLTLTEALQFVVQLFDTAPPSPPGVESKKAYELQPRDPIFGSLREDYLDFDGWLRKCQREHRQSWIIPARHVSAYAAVCIVKQEPDGGRFRESKTLKICTFKVSDEWSGLAYGELLLRTVLDYAHNNGYEMLYITILPKHEALVHFLQKFGFRCLGTQTKLDENQYVKRLRAEPDEDIDLDALEYHIRYGPYVWKWDRNSAWIVPIQPRYHKMLFPANEAQMTLLPDPRPPGNSIRKAYLCSAPRQISPGDLLLFYRSSDDRALTVLGVTENTLVSASPDEIAAFVGKRTVYRYDDMKEMCSGGRRVLAVLFRYAHDLRPKIRCAQLIQHGLLTAPPQSIQRIRRKGDLSWLRKRLGEL